MAYTPVTDVSGTATGASVGGGHCGAMVGPFADGTWSQSRRDAPVEKAGTPVWMDPPAGTDAETVFFRLFCPACLTAAHSRVAPVDHPVVARVVRSFA